MYIYVYNGRWKDPGSRGDMRERGEIAALFKECKLANLRDDFRPPGISEGKIMRTLGIDLIMRGWEDIGRCVLPYSIYST